MQRLAATTVLGLIVLVAAAGCGDDKKGRKPAGQLPGPDGGALEPGDDDGPLDPEEGFIDGGRDTMDASLPDGGRGDASADASSDGSAPSGRADGGALSDASDASDAGPGEPGADGGCDVDDPRFGCGRATAGSDWVRFESGLEIDRKTGLGWSPVVQAESDDVLDEMCNELELAGLDDFRLPDIRDVRTLAAGCPQTLPEGACEVREGIAPQGTPGCGACDPAVNAPPHKSGSYCRPEVPDCDLLWTLTHCGPNGAGCPNHQHWFYIPSTGAVELHDYGTEVANAAKGRCVTKVPEPLP